MGRPALKLEGKSFGFLTVIERTESSEAAAHWLCLCFCGNFTTARGTSLRRLETISCGCQKGKQPEFLKTAGGLSKTAAYRSWASMINRCRNPNYHAYHRYGGRGITVCKRWLSYENFLADMGKRPSNKHSLDRINNSKGYSPSNCRWATRSQQQKNKRTTRLFTDGKFVGSLVECASKVGISKELEFYRFKNWETFERGKLWQNLQRGVEKMKLLRFLSNVVLIISFLLLAVSVAVAYLILLPASRVTLLVSNVRQVTRSVQLA